MASANGPGGIGLGGRLGQAGGPGKVQGGASPSAKSGMDFAQVLGQQLAVKFSAHAAERLQSRPLTPGEMDRLNRGIQKAASEGARDSLVIVSDLALVVNVPNRTVVTAVGGERLKEGVFTNIDSAVIV